MIEMNEDQPLRIELEASPSDAGLLRSAVEVLREDSEAARRLRRLLREALSFESSASNLEELLESAPLEAVDLPRRKDDPRDSGW